MFPQPPGSHRPDTPCPSSTLVLSGGRGRWSPPPVLPFRRRGAGLQASTSALALLVSGVAGEGARRRELAQLMADHFLIDEDGDELAAVVEIGRASCRERVCQYVQDTVVAVSLQKKKDNKPKHIQY